MSCAKPHQNDLLLPGQQMVVIPLWSWHCERSDESLLFTEADIVGMLFSSGTLLCQDARLLISWYSTVGWNPLQNSPPVSCNVLLGFGQVWELVVLVCLQDGEGVREEYNLFAFMIWSLDYGGSLYVGFCFCTVIGAVLSYGHACWDFLSSWEVDQYTCPSVGHRVRCWPISEYMDPCFLGYLSTIIAKVRDCFTVSYCVSLEEREGTVVWTLMSVMSVTQGSDMSGGKKGSVLWGSLSWNWWFSFLLSWFITMT